MMRNQSQNRIPFKYDEDSGSPMCSMFYYSNCCFLAKQGDECGNLADFNSSTLSVQYSFSNFSFKVKLSTPTFIFSYHEKNYNIWWIWVVVAFSITFLDLNTLWCIRFWIVIHQVLQYLISDLLCYILIINQTNCAGKRVRLREGKSQNYIFLHRNYNTVVVMKASFDTSFSQAWTDMFFFFGPI